MDNPSSDGRPATSMELGMAGRHHLLQPLAHGGMAEVFKAALKGPQGFERSVAVKRILPHLSTDREFRTMFIDEAKIATALTHPNIVQVYELGEDGGNLYIVMELVDGRDLKKLMESAGPKGLPVPVAAFIGREVARALDYAHRKNVIHRDVSPHNLLLSWEGEVKLADFGIAKASLKASETSAGMLKGKFAYMSPEQASGLPLDARTDIFSLGTVLYEMLAGQRLFLADTDMNTLKKVQEARVLPLSSVRPGVPRKIEEVVLRALRKNPKDRYDTSKELAEDMDLILGASGIRTPQDILTEYLRNSFSPGRHGPARGAISREATEDVNWRRVRGKTTIVWKHGLGAGLVLMGLVGTVAWLYNRGEGRAVITDPPVPGFVRSEFQGEGAPGRSPTEAAAGANIGPQASSAGPTARGNDNKDHSATKQDGTLIVRTRMLKRQEGTLEVRVGTVDIGSKPWADVYIDGKTLGRTTPVLGLKITEGRHRIRLVNPALRREKEVDIEVRGGETVPLIVDLQAVPPPTPSGR